VNGPLDLSVADFGAVADGRTDCSPAFEAAHAALLAAMGAYPGVKGTVRWPVAPLPYAISREMRLSDSNVRVESDGAIIRSTGGRPCVIVGLRDTEASVLGPLALTPAHRPDLFGKLDASIFDGGVAAPGKLWGIRLNGDSSLMFQACPMSLGRVLPDNITLDNWSTTSQLTLEFCVESPSGGPFVGGGAVFSMGVYDDPSPMSLIISGDPNTFDFRFKDAGGSVHLVKLSAPPSASGPLKMALQFDLAARTVRAFAGGFQVAAVASDGSFAAKGATTLFENQYAPLIFGGAYSYAPPVGVAGAGSTYDLRLYGFAISGCLRYKAGAVGSPQLRADTGEAPDDDYRYGFGNAADSHLIGRLALTDPPSKGRLVSARVLGDDPCVGYLVQSAMFTADGGIMGNALRGLQLIGPRWMPTVVVGGALGLTVEDCDISDGTHAIGSLNLVANYPQAIRDCRLSGSDSGYYGAMQTARMENVRFVQAGRVPMRFWASNLSASGVWVNGFGAAHAGSIFRAHAGQYGGSYRIEDVTVDFESSGVSGAVIVLEQHPPPALATTLILRNWYVGSVGASPALIRVRTLPYDGVHAVILDVDSFQSGGSATSHVLDADGPAVTGTVRVISGCPTQPPLLDRATHGPSSNVVVIVGPARSPAITPPTPPPTPTTPTETSDG